MTPNVYLSCVQMPGRGKGRAWRPSRRLQEVTETEEWQSDRSPLEQHQSPVQANGDNLQFDLPTNSSVSAPTIVHVSSNAAPNNLPLAPFPQYHNANFVSNPLMFWPFMEPSQTESQLHPTLPTQHHFQQEATSEPAVLMPQSAEQRRVVESTAGPII